MGKPSEVDLSLYDLERPTLVTTTAVLNDLKP